MYIAEDTLICNIQNIHIADGKVKFAPKAVKKKLANRIVAHIEAVCNSENNHDANSNNFSVLLVLPCMPFEGRENNNFAVHCLAMVLQSNQNQECANYKRSQKRYNNAPYMLISNLHGLLTPIRTMKNAFEWVTFVPAIQNNYIFFFGSKSPPYLC
jgi:hypothetical protein